jgi:chloramphenicol O-acetyltransferase type A
MSPAALTPSEPVYLDVTQWPRRAAFEHFRDFDQPFFSLCVRLDVAPLKAWLAAEPGRSGPGSFSLACHYLALRLANEHPAFRLRLEGQGPAARVRLHARVDASTTVLRADDSFGFAQLPWRSDFAGFRAQGQAALQAVREGPPGFHEPVPAPGDTLAASGEAATMYFTTLPWVHFSGFMHARPGAGRDDSTPRVVFGRAQAEAGAGAGPQWMPLQLDVHHALMDGLQAGHWLQALEAALAAPEAWLG